MEEFDKELPKTEIIQESLEKQLAEEREEKADLEKTGIIKLANDYRIEFIHSKNFIHRDIKKNFQRLDIGFPAQGNLA